MNRAEFNEWFAYHCGAFRNLADWFARLGEEESEKTLGHWFRVLRSVSLEEASRATERLFSGDEPEPKSRDKIPAAIRAIVKGSHGGGTIGRESRPMYIDGEPVYECNFCDDEGRVIIEAVTGPDDSFPGYPYTAAVACSCRHGDFWLRQGLIRVPSGAVLV